MEHWFTPSVRKIRISLPPSPLWAQKCAIGIQLKQKFAQVFRQRRLNTKLSPGYRMHNFDCKGMQEHALETSLGTEPHQLPVQCEVSILIVACYGEIQMSEMHANLMSTARF